VKRAACLLGLALIAAGCGGGSERLSKSAYQAKLHSAFVAAQELESAAHDDNSDQAKVLKGVAASYASLASALEGVRAPMAVQALNDRLVAGASAQAKALDVLVSRLVRTPKALRYRVLAEFDANDVPGQREFDQAVAALEAKGYRFRPSGGT
jgi:hypothetical protein